MHKVESSLQFAPWVKAIAHSSTRLFVGEVTSRVKDCVELDRELPDSHEWHFTTDEVFANRAKREPRNLFALSELYWTDMLNNIKAYNLTTCWRALELLKPAIRCLNAKEIIPAAVCARSLLELAAAYVINANTLSATFSQLETVDKSRPLSIGFNKEIETAIVRMLWGTRLPDQPDYVRQKNISSLIQRVAKRPHQQDLLPTYEYLCEIAHPNVVGNARFWSHVKRVLPNGTEIRVISRSSAEKGSEAGSEAARGIVERILWAISWSSACVKDSYSSFIYPYNITTRIPYSDSIRLI